MKKTQSQKNRLKLQDFTDLFMTRNKVIKNSTYYNRLYSTKPNTINMSSSLSKDITNNNLILSSPNNNNISNTNKEIRTPKNRIFSSKKKMLWPKVTKPIWPFSLKIKEPRDLIQKRLSLAKPSEKYHTFETIRWLNQKYSDSVKQKSIFSLLPNKGKQIIPKNETEKGKRHRKIIEYLESFRAPKAREKNVEINPKYFYNKQTFEKIKKMKEMFLTFDKEGKQRLLLKEIVKLFKNNDIEVDIEEIKELFFKNINNINAKNTPINILYLNFYQFLKFALSRDQDFRQFIRKVKKNKKNKLIKKDAYFPMDFNTALEYFMRKEKQRNSVKAVQDAIKGMDKMMKIENEEALEKSSNLISDEFSMSRKSNNLFLLSSKSNNNKIISKMSTNNNLLEENNLKDINFSELIEDFSSLFGINQPKKKLEENKINNKNKRFAKSAKIKNNKMNGDNPIYTEELKSKLRKETLKDLNIENFKKYKNLRLALEATKEQINYMKTHNNKSKNGLIEEDKQTIDMVDTRNIVHVNNLIHSPKKIFKLKNQNFLENIDNNSLLLNVYLDNRNKNRKKNLKEKFNKTRNNVNKKPIYNIYCGSHIIINNELKSNSKYDFVPNELII